MKITRMKFAALVAASSLVLLGACGSDDASSAPSDKTTETTSQGGDSTEPEITSSLDIAARSLSTVMSEKIEGYEVDGNTVRLKVRSGITLSGSECVIINAATESDHPDATFILVNGGEEITC